MKRSVRVTKIISRQKMMTARDCDDELENFRANFCALRLRDEGRDGRDAEDEVEVLVDVAEDLVEDVELEVEVLVGLVDSELEGEA